MSSLDHTPPDSIDERVIELEAKLIEQEHRITHIVYNFWNQKRLFPNASDPRRNACSRAVVWRIFSSPTTALAGSGVVGLLSVIILIWQTLLLSDNNELLRRQMQPIAEIYASASSASFTDRQLTVDVVIFNPGSESCYIENGQWVADSNDIGHGHGVIHPVGNRIVPAKTMEKVRLVVDDAIDLTKVINGTHKASAELFELRGIDYLVGIEFDVIARVPSTKKLATKFKCELHSSKNFDEYWVYPQLVPEEPLKLQVSDALIPRD